MIADTRGFRIQQHNSQQRHNVGVLGLKYEIQQGLIVHSLREREGGREEGGRKVRGRREEGGERKGGGGGRPGPGLKIFIQFNNLPL